MLKPPPAIPGMKHRGESFDQMIDSTGSRNSKSAANAEKKAKETHDRILKGVAQRHLGIDNIHDTDTQDAPHTKSGLALHAALRAAFDAERMAKA